MNSLKLIMIAYYFPPLGGAGVQRAAKFAKYLAQAGWSIEVIAAAPAPFEPLDESLLAEVTTARIQVHRIPNRERFRGLDRFPGGWRLRGFLQKWLFFPDRMAGWYKPALAKAEEIAAANPGIALLTTSAPYTAHRIGLSLKQRFQLFWAADFRDEWTQNPYFKAPTPWHWRRHRRLERQVLLEADCVISVTEEITKGLQGLISDSPDRFTTIPNGFDPDDFDNIKLQTSGYFTITHTGSLNPARSAMLPPLFDALRQLIAEERIPGAQLRLRLVGPGDLRGAALPKEEWVRIEASIPHHEALQAMAESDLLVLAEPNPAAYTGKIFEYLGVRRPIIGLVDPRSPAAELIRRAQAGWVNGDPEMLAEVIFKAYQAWQCGVSVWQPDETVLAAFNRKRQADQLAEIIREGQSHAG